MLKKMLDRRVARNVAETRADRPDPACSKSHQTTIRANIAGMLIAGFAVTFATVAALAIEFIRHSVKRGASLPAYAWVAAAALLVACLLMVRGVYPVAVYFTPIAWTCYIVLVDGAVLALTGRSRLHDNPREFAIMALLSMPLWLIFEAYNLRLKNWTYVGVPQHLAMAVLGYGWSFATITPAILQTASLVEGFGWFGSGRPVRFSAATERSMMIFGATCLVLPLLLPATIASYLFTLIWIGFVFLLDPVNRRLGLPSLLDDFAHGQRNRFWSLFVAGWTCGWLWELWNYWAAAKWHYTFPMFQQLKIFEMPIPGYLGFLPFALECFVMYTSARWLLGKFGLAQAQDASPQATALPQPAPYYRAKQGNLLTDMPYGICPNTEHGCELSYRSKRLAHLHDLLQRMQAQESRGAQVQEIETLAWFARYFQTGTTCKTCGVALCTAFQPTTGLDEQAEEYERRIRLNHLLALTGELQARGVL